MTNAIVENMNATCMARCSSSKGQPAAAPEEAGALLAHVVGAAAVVRLFFTNGSLSSFASGFL